MNADEVAAELAAAAPAAGLLLEFDGTLAPIVRDPADAQPTPGVAGVLVRLARRLAVVAVVSGRPAAFLAAHLGSTGGRLLGLYGMEEHRDGAVHAHPDAARWQPEVEAARRALEEVALGVPGAWVEDKGLSVALHWRNAAAREEAEAALPAAVDRVGEDTGLSVEPGKYVAELRPPLGLDKGTAVRQSAPQDLRALAYVGDDRGDLAAFAAVRALGGRCVAVRHGSETPVELIAGADAVLDGSDGVARWLSALAARLE